MAPVNSDVQCIYPWWSMLQDLLWIRWIWCPLTYIIKSKTFHNFEAAQFIFKIPMCPRCHRVWTFQYIILEPGEFMGSLPSYCMDLRGRLNIAQPSSRSYREFSKALGRYFHIFNRSGRLLANLLPNYIAICSFHYKISRRLRFREI